VIVVKRPCSRRESERGVCRQQRKGKISECFLSNVLLDIQRRLEVIATRISKAAQCECREETTDNNWAALAPIKSQYISEQIEQLFVYPCFFDDMLMIMSRSMLAEGAALFGGSHLAIQGS
jgi:acetone carboxylase gamma subunit